VKYFYYKLFNTHLDNTDFENRIKMQKLVYLLTYYGVIFSNYRFTWWRYGPYSPQLADDAFTFHNIDHASPSIDELETFRKVERGRSILKNAENSELIASYLYLVSRMTDPTPEDVLEELLQRKPYFTPEQIQEVMSVWEEALGTPIYS
jgi:uncharacterized protein YwgA